VKFGCSGSGPLSLDNSGKTIPQTDYPIPTGVVTSGVDTGKKIYTNFANPISTEMNNINDFRVNVGFRLKFLVLGCFFADYTLAKYSTLTAGLGISFR
jgi:hypothetical protein